MTDLSGALPRGGDFKKTELKVSYGAHKGYWIGLSDTIQEQSTFACGTCKGQRTVSGDQCNPCKGSGFKISTKVAMLYQFKLPTGEVITDEEWMTYTLSEPGTLKNGTPKSGSTLWSRMKALSGFSNPAEQAKWYAALPKPVKVAIEVMVVDNTAGTSVVIASLRRLNHPGATAPAPAPAPASNPAPEPVDDDYVPFPDDTGDVPF